MLENYDKRKRLVDTNKFFNSKKRVAVFAATLFILLCLITNAISSIGAIYKGETSFLKEAFSFKLSFFVYLIFAVIVSIGAIKFYIEAKLAFGNLNVGQKGSQRWTTREELNQQYRLIPEKAANFPGGGGVPIARTEDHIYIDDSPVNNLIIGITRSGKGELIVFPEIDIYSRADKKASLIMTDPKLELAAATMDKLKARGYECHVLNLVDPEFSMGYNPLTAIIDSYKEKRYADAELLCSSLCFSIFNPSPSAQSGDSQFWSDNSTALLSALILAACEDNLEADRLLNLKLQEEVENKNEELKQKALTKLSETERELYVLKERAERELKDNPSLDVIGLCNIIFDDEFIDIEDDNDIYQEYLDLLKEALTSEIKLDYKAVEFTPVQYHEKKINLFSIISTFSTLSSKQINQKKNALDLYFESRPEGNRARLKYATIGTAGDKTKGSIYSNTLSRLQVFTYENIAKMTAESNVDLLNVGFGDKPVAVFIGIPDYDRSNHFIATVFIKQLYFTLAKAATHEPTGKCKREVVFILDEFGNLPPIEDMSNIITVCLGRNMRFNLIIQDFAQVKNLYGENSATIISNCSNQIYIMTNDNDTAEQYSKNVGSETYTNINRSGKRFSLSKEYVENQDERRLITPEELRNLKEGEMIVTRVIKRKDLAGQAITSYPIASIGSNRMKYRYEYLLSDFPTRTLQELDDLEKIDHINLKERTFLAESYYNKQFLLNYPVKYKNKDGETFRQLTEEEIDTICREQNFSDEEKKMFLDSIEKGLTLLDIYNMAQLLSRVDQQKQNGLALLKHIEKIFKSKGIPDEDEAFVKNYLKSKEVKN